MPNFIILIIILIFLSSTLAIEYTNTLDLTCNVPLLRNAADMELLDIQLGSPPLQQGEFTVHGKIPAEFRSTTAAAVITVYLQDDIVAVSIVPIGVAFEIGIPDRHQPLKPERNVCVFATDLQSNVLGAASLILKEYRVEVPKPNEMQASLDPELLDIMAHDNWADVPIKSFIALGGNKETVFPLVANEWQGILFTFDEGTGKYSSLDSSLLVVSLFEHETQEEVLNTIESTLKDIGMAKETTLDLLIVETVSCPSSLLKHLIPILQPKLIRIAFPIDLPLQLALDIDFDPRIEPLNPFLISAGAHGCSFSQLSATLPSLGYHPVSCGNQHVRSSSAPDTLLDATPEIPVPGQSYWTATRRRSTISTTIQSCLKSSRCHGFNPRFAPANLGCRSIHAVTATPEGLLHLQGHIQLVLGLQAGVHPPPTFSIRRVEQAGLVPKYLESFWNKHVASSPSSELFYSSLFISPYLGTSPLSLGVIKHNMPVVFQHVLDRILNLSTLAPEKSVSFIPPSVPGRALTLLDIHFSSSSNKVSLVFLGRLSSLSTAFIVRLSGPAILDELGVSYPNTNTTVEFSLRSSGLYLVEVAELMKFDATRESSSKARWRVPIINNETEKPVRYEVAVFGTKIDSTRQKDSREYCMEGQGEWRKRKIHDDDIVSHCNAIPSSSSPPLLQDWYWQPNDCKLDVYCAMDAYQCFARKSGPIVFIGNSHTRDIYFETALVQFYEGPNHYSSVPRSMHVGYESLKHGSTYISVPRPKEGDPPQQFGFFFCKDISAVVQRLESLSQMSSKAAQLSIKLPEQQYKRIDLDFWSIDSESVAVISIGQWDVEINATSAADMEESLEELSNALQVTQSQYPDLEIFLLNIPPFGTRIPHYIYEINMKVSQKLKEMLLQHSGNNIKILDWFHPMLADSDAILSDSFHGGATCETCDRHGRLAAVTVVNAMASMLCRFS